MEEAAPEVELSLESEVASAAVVVIEIEIENEEIENEEIENGEIEIEAVREIEDQEDQSYQVVDYPFHHAKDWHMSHMKMIRYGASSR